MIGTLTGPYTTWTLFDHERKYGTVQNLPFAEANELIMAVMHNGQTGKGQQRETVLAHVRKLKAEMEAGNFTPTNVSAALEKRHRDKLVLAAGGFSLAVDSEDPLLQTDGGHRYTALGLIIKELTEKAAKASGDEKAKYERWLGQARRLPVTVTVYFDGDPSKDFLNLQAGRPVDTSHLLSLGLKAKLVDDPALKLGFEVAKLLQKDAGSPFHNNIKFDSRGTLPLPISTLCSRGASDLGTSLVGLAKVGLAGEAKKDAHFLATAVVAAFDILKTMDAAATDREGILEYGRVLTPLANEGKKGQSTMLVGVGVVLAYRLAALGKAAPDQDDRTKFADAAFATLDRKVSGSFSGPQKRQLLAEFAKEFLADLAGPKHHGLPVSLLKVLPPSAFAVPPLPKEPKPPKPAPAPKPPKAKKKKAGEQESPAGETVVVTTEPVAVPAPAPAAEPVAEAPPAPPADAPVVEVAAPWEPAAAEAPAVDPWAAELAG